MSAAIPPDAPPALPFDISAEVFVMKQFMKTKEAKAVLAAYPKLTYDSAAAIYLFTCESPLYRQLNKKLRDRDRKALKNGFFPYVRLLFSGYEAMLKPDARMVNRGVKMDLVSAAPGKYETGESVRMLSSLAFLFVRCGARAPPTASSALARSRHRPTSLRTSPLPSSSLIEVCGAGPCVCS
eukprot:COSAG02_NODE_1127_length_14428_cov_68.304627_7_plen_182_part_00